MLRMIPSIVPPTNCAIAFSGGVDSLAVAHFLKKGNKQPVLLHFNHGCEHSDKIAKECIEKANQLGLGIIVQKIKNPTPPKGISLEEHWRNERYNFLKQYDCTPVITCHHLNDAMETWLWSSMHGEGKIIPHTRGNIIRPFLLTTKEKFVKYCERHGLEAVHDPYNEDYNLTRNFIRANIMPLAERVNPGFEKVIRKKYLELK